MAAGVTGAVAMKWGEIVILWIGGGLTIFSMVTNPPISNELGVMWDLDGLWPIISIWIVCGLIWITIYKRKK